jgi:hypothetical protein
MLTKGYFPAFFYGSELQKICCLGSVCKVESSRLQIHLQHILLLAANTNLFSFLLFSGKINNSSCKMAAHQNDKKHPAPPPPLTYNG